MNEGPHDKRFKTGRRPVEVVVISDIHLGTVGCHARELLSYLRSIHPRVLILNGDVIDIWQFTKYYWPRAHMKVLKRLLKILASGTEVYYVTGNHDDLLRKYGEQHLGNLHLVNKVVLTLGGRKVWFFHGDVFDVVQRHSRWLVKLGSLGYDLLILINRMANALSLALGQGRISISKRIKDGVKSAVNFIGNFEETAAAAALEHGFDVVVCGHIHQPVMRQVEAEGGRVLYLNSGDWIENLTALEFNEGSWTLFRFREHAEKLGAVETLLPAEDEETPAERAVGRLAVPLDFLPGP